MKKGLLQRASKNWEEIKLVNVPIKDEPSIECHHDLRKSVLQSESSKSLDNNETTTLVTTKQQLNQQPQQQSRKVQSMIAIRKDYSYKYLTNSKYIPTNAAAVACAPSSSSISSQYNYLDISQNVSQSQSYNEQQQATIIKKEMNCSSIKPLLLKRQQKPLKLMFKPKEVSKRSIKPNISILERHDYDCRSKVIKLENEKSFDEEKEVEYEESYDAEKNSFCAIDEIQKMNETKSSSSIYNLTSNNVPIDYSDIKAENIKRKEYCERDKLKVVVAQEENTRHVNVKQEFCDSTTPTTSQQQQQHLRKPTLSTESKDSQNINKINNKINIIFQLNDNTKSLRKNIILHRRTPKKMVQKITIKEANNNSTTKIQSDCETTLVPENKILCTIETQTEEVKKIDINMSLTNPLKDEITEHLFFENDIMISLQSNTISFFGLDRLSLLLKKGETDFQLIDRISRRIHDIQVDNDNKFQRLCYNDVNSLPIYVEMRAKQKQLDDPLINCPIAFIYCNIYYIDQNQNNAKFSSVHLDTVKSIVNDIKYTTVPNSSYFIMSWHENLPDKKASMSGIVKYKLTPNLDLAKLASIRPFPKLDYRIKQMYCGKDFQLVTIGDTQVSIFNYESGDLLMSFDLMKSYGINLTSFTYEGSYLFLVYLADIDDDFTVRKLMVIGVHKYDTNSFKVIQSIPVKIGRYEKILSRSITSTNHLIVTFSNGSSIMMYLNNFQDVHVKYSPKSSTLVANNDYMLATSVENINNVGLCHFTEYFLNA